MTCAPELLYEQVAYVAFNFHWSRDEILDLEHAERLRYVDEIGRLSQRGRRG